jgi:hypothetical protein
VQDLANTATAREGRMVLHDADQDDDPMTPHAEAPGSPQGIAQLRNGGERGAGNELVRLGSNSSGAQIKYKSVYGEENTLYNELHSNSDNNMPLQMTIAAVNLHNEKILTNKLNKEFQEKMALKDAATLKMTEEMLKDYKDRNEKISNDNREMQQNLLSALINGRNGDAGHMPPTMKRKLEVISQKSPASARADNLDVALKMLISGKKKIMGLGLKFLKRMAHESDHSDLDTIYDDIIESADPVDSKDVYAQVKVHTTNTIITSSPYTHNAQTWITAHLCHTTTSTFKYKYTNKPLRCCSTFPRKNRLLRSHA